MKKFLLGGLVVILLAAYFLYTPPAQSAFLLTVEQLNLTEPLLNYTHSNFTMSYPASWYMQTNPEAGIAVRMVGPADVDGYLVVVYVSKLEDKGPVTDEVAERQVAVLNTLYVNSYSEIKKQFYGGKYWIIGEVTDPDDPLYLDQALVDCGGTIYSTISSVPKTLPANLPLARFVVNTFKCS